MGSPDFRETFLYGIKELNGLNLGYVHIMDWLAFGFHEQGEPMTLAEFRAEYDGIIVGRRGCTKEIAEERLAAGHADRVPVSYLRLLISNQNSLHMDLNFLIPGDSLFYRHIRSGGYMFESKEIRKESIMSDFVVIGFDDENTAFEMRAELAKMQKEYLIEINYHPVF
jgi:hypothetical protein